MAAPLVVIVGPTASGKSALALNIAKLHSGEIICADSRTIYRGMDIGTAKPTAIERASVPHHMLDIIEPSQSYTAAAFKAKALEAIEDVHKREKLPIIVGGTGLYIDSIIYDFAFLPPVPQEEREFLQGMSVEQLQKRLKEQGIAFPSNSQNPRHLIRALETNGAVPIKKDLRANTLILGVDISKEALHERVKQRVGLMLEQGLEAEARQLASQFGWDAPGLSAVGYREWQNHKSHAEVEDEIIRDTMQYAKRQRTWFKRNPSIVWVKNSAEAEALTKKFLQNQA